MRKIVFFSLFPPSEKNGKMIDKVYHSGIFVS